MCIRDSYSPEKWTEQKRIKSERQTNTFSLKQLSRYLFLSLLTFSSCPFLLMECGMIREIRKQIQTSLKNVLPKIILMLTYFWYALNLARVKMSVFSERVYYK